MKNFTITEIPQASDLDNENEQSEELKENYVILSNMPKVKVKTAVNFFDENQGQINSNLVIDNFPIVSIENNNNHPS